MTAQGPEGAGEGAARGAAGGPTEEELQAALEEQMRRVTVPDVLVQTVVTLLNLGARKLGLAPAPGEGEGRAEERDLEQARLAIEATRALIPLLPEDVGRIRDALSQLQVAYAREARAGAASGAPGSSTAAPAGAEERPSGEPEQAPSTEEAERARARSRIWTPPGA